MSTPALAILEEPARPGGPREPTDPESAQRQVAQSLPTIQSLRRRSLLRLGLLLALLVLVLAAPTVSLAAQLASLALLGAFLIVVLRDRAVSRKLGEGQARVEELTLLGRHAEAWDLAYLTLPLCHRHPLGHEAWLRLTLAMGRAAMWGGTYDTAESLVSLVSERIGPDHPLRPFCHVQRSLAAAFDGRPGVAEDELVAVRGLLRRSASPQADAVLMVAELAQAYAAHQPGRAVERLSDQPREQTLAPLGRDAGIGHLLAAWAYEQTGDLTFARSAWRDAVLLMGVEACRAVLDLDIDAGEPTARDQECRPEPQQKDDTSAPAPGEGHDE